MAGMLEIVLKTKEVFDKEVENLNFEMESLKEFRSRFDVLIQDVKLRERKIKPIRYKTGSLFLKECFEYLTSSPDEAIHLVSGMKLDEENYILDRLEKVQYQATVVGAKADVRSLFQKLAKMDSTYGHSLLAVFHSHPCKGVGGTCPSGIDKNLQDNLEKCGYKAIQAIFSRDGFIRFFSNALAFEIEIFGKGVERMEEKENGKIFKLSEVGVQAVFNPGDGAGGLRPAEPNPGVQPKESGVSRCHLNWSWRPWRRNS